MSEQFIKEITLPNNEVYAIKDENARNSIVSLQNTVSTLSTSVEDIRLAINGNLYKAEVNSTPAHIKIFGTNVMPYISIDRVGGHSEVVNGELINYTPISISGDGMFYFRDLTDKYFPTGMKSLNSELYDELDFEKRYAYQRVAMIDLGDLSWTKSGSSQAGTFYTNGLNNNKANGGASGSASKLLCSKYATTNVTTNPKGRADNSILEQPNNGTIYIHDETSYASMTAAQFKSSLSGVKLIFVLANEVQTIITENVNNFVSIRNTGTIAIGDDQQSVQALPNTETVIVKLPDVV